jgi:ribosomal-protein-serine acetyltransferase
MNPLEIRVDENTILRLREENDTKDLFDFVNNNRAFLREWLPWLDFSQTLDDSQKFIQDSLENYNNKKDITLGIFYNGKIAGSVGFHSLDLSHKNGSMGYMLGEEYTGKGIMIKSVKSLINFAFTELDLNRISIRCATANKKSRAIPEKLGFKLEGIIEQNEWLYDHFVDHAQYAMLRENWEKK